MLFYQEITLHQQLPNQQTIANFEFHKQTKATFTLESKNSSNIQEKNISTSLTQLFI